MATSRFLFHPYLVNPALVVNMTASGGATAQSSPRLSAVQRYQGGNAGFAPGGVYTSLQERYYQVQVTFTTDGTFANTRYRWNDGTSPGWNEENLTPVNGVPKLLSNGITITFVASGVLPEFTTGDVWWFKVTYPYGVWAALDGSRNTEWRSGAVPIGGSVQWEIDFGIPVQPFAYYFLDENFPGLTMAWLASSTGFSGAASYTHVPTMRTGRMLEFIAPPAAYRYWRLWFLNNSAFAFPYIRMSELYLGSYVSLSKNFLVDFGRPRRRLAAVGQGLRYGVGPGSLSGEDLEVEFSRMPAADHTLFENLWAYTNRPDLGAQVPFAVMPSDADPTWWSLYHWTNDFERQHGPAYRYSAPMQFQEVVRSRA